MKTWFSWASCLRFQACLVSYGDLVVYTRTDTYEISTALILML